MSTSEYCSVCGGWKPPLNKSYSYSGHICLGNHFKVPQFTDTNQFTIDYIKSLNDIIESKEYVIKQLTERIEKLEDKLQDIHLDYAEGESRREYLEDQDE